MSKVEILTPVHVGTGNTIEPIRYSIKDGEAFCYSLNDILSNISPDKLTDPKILSNILKAKNKSQYLNLFKLDHISGKPLYKLTWRISDEINFVEKNGKITSEDIYEQVKSLGKPTIPGSTLKGAIECAFKYSFLKANLFSAKKHIHSFIEQATNHSYRGTPDEFYLNLVFGYKNDKIHRDFVKDLYSLLVVRDVHFDQMEAFYVDRYSIFEDSSIPLGILECIKPASTSDIPSLFSIDKERVRFVKEAYKDFPSLQRVIEQFTDETFLIEAIHTYIADMISSESKEPYPDFYSEFRGTSLIMNQIKDEIRQSNQTHSSIVMRIGKANTYFFKTVSWLFKKEFPQYFDDYSIFYKVFSPARGGNKNSPKPEDLPRSIPLLDNTSSTYPAGFIKVTL